MTDFGNRSRSLLNLGEIMATIRKRTLPSGLVRWQVDFTDQVGKRRSKLFPRRKDADIYLVKVRSLVANHT